MITLDGKNYEEGDLYRDTAGRLWKVQENKWDLLGYPSEIDPDPANVDDKVYGFELMLKLGEAFRKVESRLDKKYVMYSPGTEQKTPIRTVWEGRKTIGTIKAITVNEHGEIN